MLLAIKLSGIFPVEEGGAAPVQDAGTLPRINDFHSYEIFNEQVQARTSAASDTYRRDDLLDAGVEVLAESSRDMKVLVILGDVLFSGERPDDLAPLVAYVGVLERALGSYWSKMHPLPESKNWMRIRQGLLGQMMTGLERASRWTFPKSSRDKGLELQAAIQAIANLTIWDGDWIGTGRALGDVAKTIEAALVQAAAPAPETSMQKVEARAATMPQRELRQRLLELSGQFPVVDVAEGVAMDVPLAFMIRRKAAFLAFEGEVLATKGKTSLTDIAPDRVSEVLATTKAPTPEALSAIEVTLQSRPLWLTGHRLAAEMAKALSGTDQSEAIHAATKEEVTTLGFAILDYEFKGGLPFADVATKSWLLEKRAKTVETTAVAEQTGVTSLVDKLEAGLEAREFSASQGRARALILTDLAEALAAEGQGHLATMLAAQVRDELEYRDLLPWEIELDGRLAALIR